MNKHQIGVPRLQSFNRTGSAMGRTIVNNPKDTPRCGIGRLAHHFIDKATGGCDAGSAFAPPEHFSAMHVQGGNIGPGTAPDVFMLHFHGCTRLGRIGGVSTPTLLDAGFFIGRQNELVILKGMSLPNPFIEIQDSTGFFGTLRIARENPGTIAPRTNGILMKPSPNGAVTDCRGQSRSSNLPAQINNAPSGKGNLMGRGQFTGNRLNLNDDFPREKSGGVPDEVVLQAQGDVLQRNVFATC